MEVSSYMFLGLGAGISVLAFFLKRMKEEIDTLKKLSATIEITNARNCEKLKNLEKSAEDRREDVRKIYDIVQK